MTEESFLDTGLVDQLFEERICYHVMWWKLKKFWYRADNNVIKAENRERSID